MTERLSYDPPKLTPDEATELCVYHLRQAAALFQLVPDDENKALLSEIERQCSDGLDEVDKTPAVIWAGYMFHGYQIMKDNDQ